MNTKLLLMFAAIATVLGTVGSAVVIQPASAQFDQQNDQGDCILDCSNSQSLQLENSGDNNQENTS